MITKQNRVRISLALTLLALCGSLPAWGHVGPPYPILENQKVGNLTVAVWSNPDVGTGSFFVVLDPAPGTSVPSDMKVKIIVQPVSKRLSEASYDAWREKLLSRVEFKAVVPFDKEETWRVRILLASPSVTGEIATDVPVTPTLLGSWSLLLFLLPFLGIGAVWLRALSVRRKRRARMRLKKTQTPAG